MALVRSDPFRDVDRLFQQLAGVPNRAGRCRCPWMRFARATPS